MKCLLCFAALAVCALATPSVTLTAVTFDGLPITNSPLSATPYGQPVVYENLKVSSPGVEATCTKKGGCVLSISYLITGGNANVLQLTVRAGPNQDVTTTVVRDVNGTQSGTIDIRVDYDPTSSFDQKRTVEFTLIAQLFVTGRTQSIDQTRYFRVNLLDSFDLVTAVASGQSFFIVDPTNAKVAFSLAGLTLPVTIQCLGIQQCAPTSTFDIISGQGNGVVFTVTEFDAAVSPKIGYFYLRVLGAAAQKLVALDQTNIVQITGANGVVLNVPVSFANLFNSLTSASLALAPGQVRSAFGETNRAVFTTIPNKTVTVNAVRNGRVPDDEFKNVSAGIVYAAVGSAFAFVLCLGAIAAMLGAKAAAKA